MAHGKLVLLIGPSGVGKSAIMKKLRTKHPEFHYPRSATTRAKRKGEGTENYHFVSEEKFDELLSNGKLLEWALVHGIGRYGTMVDEIIPPIDEGKTVVREIDVQGFESIRNDARFSGSGAPYRLHSIFIEPESTSQLIKHIQKRSPMSEDELKKRLHSMEHEMQYAEKCTHRIVNREGKLMVTYKTVEEMIGE